MDRVPLFMGCCQAAWRTVCPLNISTSSAPCQCTRNPNLWRVESLPVRVMHEGSFVLFLFSYLLKIVLLCVA